MVISDSPGSSDIITSLANATIHTPLFFLVAPVERIIAILCHTSSRALVVLSVVRKKQIYFWVGFLIMTAIDAIAGYAHLAGYVNTVSTWFIELALVPLAVASILMIKWYYEKWITNSTDP
jgi:nicotinamide riboside transporter PnuC